MVHQWRPRQIAEVRSLQSQLHSVNGRSASGDLTILPLSSMSEVLGIKTVLLSAKCSGTAPPQHRLSLKPGHLSEGRNQPSVSVMIFRALRHVPRSCFIECRLDVQAGQTHCRPYHTARFQHGNSFFLPFPVFLITCKCWATYPIYSSHVYFHPIIRFSFFFQTQNKTGCVPLRHHRCERNGPVTSDPFLWFRVWFS